jgi:hypothetical protein
MSAQEQRALTQSSLLCLVPFALGLLLWGLLPEELVFGFGPFVLLRLPKVVAVILVPLVLAALHVIVTLAHPRRTKGYIFGPARMSPWLWVAPAACAFLSVISMSVSVVPMLSVPRLFCLMGAGVALGLSYAVPSMSYGCACAVLPPFARSLCEWRRSSRTLTSLSMACAVVCALLFLVV